MTVLERAKSAAGLVRGRAKQGGAALMLLALFGRIGDDLGLVLVGPLF